MAGYATAMRGNLYKEGLENLWWTWYQYWGNDTIATGLLILLLNSTLLTLRHLAKRLPTYPPNPHSPLTTTKTTTTAPHPLSPLPSLLINLTLTIDLAIEVPLIITFHPTTLLAGPTTTTLTTLPLPMPLHLLTQVLFFSALETIFHYWLAWFLDLNPSGAGSRRKEARRGIEDHDAAPWALAMDYMRPRATLLVGMGLLGVSGGLRGVGWGVHVLGIVGWVVGRQVWVG